MNLVLKRFSQDVDLRSPEVVQYFLVFEKSDGSELRLPVQKETTEALITAVYSDSTPSKDRALEETSVEEEIAAENTRSMAEAEDYATEFGGEEGDEAEQPDEEDEGYDSEDKVPSL